MKVKLYYFGRPSTFALSLKKTLQLKNSKYSINVYLCEYLDELKYFNNVIKCSNVYTVAIVDNLKTKEINEYIQMVDDIYSSKNNYKDVAQRIWLKTLK